MDPTSRPEDPPHPNRDLASGDRESGRGAGGEGQADEGLPREATEVQLRGSGAVTGMHRLAGNTMWQVGSKWFQFLVAVGVNIGVARYLGPESLGTYTYVLSVVTVLLLFSQVGADLYLRSELIRDPDNEPAVIGSTLLLRVIAVGAVYVGLVGYAWTWHREGPELPLLLLAGAGLLCMIPDVFRSYFVGHVRADVVAIAELKGFGLAAIVKVAAILVGWPLAVFIVAGVLEWVVPGVLLLFAYLRISDRGGWKFSRLVALRVLRASAPLYVSAIAISLYLRIDQLMLRWISGPEELGYFAASARLVEKLYLVPVALGASFLPTIIGHQSGGDAGRYLGNMRRFFELNVAVGYGVIVAFLFGGTSLVVWALGPDFAPSAAILSIQVLALPLMALGVARGQYVVAERYFGFAMWTNVAGVGVNMILNLIWIPIFGGVGAALATLGTFALVHVGSSFALRKTRSWGTLQVKALLLPLYPVRCWRLGMDLRDLCRRTC